MTTQTTTRFRDLRNGDVFRFAHSVLYLGMLPGPWRKMSSRTYEYYDKPPKGHRHRIGSINAEVTLES